MLWLSEADVGALLDPQALVAALTQAFVDLAAGRAANPRETRIDDFDLRANFVAFPAYVPRSGAYAVKVLSGHHGNPPRGLPFIHAVVVLIDPHDGRILAIMGARTITAMRTAATSAVAMIALAGHAARHLVVIGSGVQARSHLSLLPRVIDVQQITVCSASGAVQRAAALAEEVGAVLGRNLQVATDVAAAVASGDLVVTCTHADAPLFAPDVLADDARLAVVGGFRPGDTEIDPKLVARAGRIVADDRNRLIGFWKDASETLPPATLARVEGLPDVVAGRGMLRSCGQTGPSVFLSHGLAIEDAVAARLVFDAASAKGAGQRLV